MGNHLGAIIRRVIILRGDYLEGSYPGGGNCPGGNYRGAQLSRGQSSGEDYRGYNYPEGNRPVPDFHMFARSINFFTFHCHILKRNFTIYNSFQRKFFKDTLKAFDDIKSKQQKMYEVMLFGYSKVCIF